MKLNLLQILEDIFKDLSEKENTSEDSSPGPSDSTKVRETFLEDPSQTTEGKETSKEDSIPPTDPPDQT